MSEQSDKPGPEKDATDDTRRRLVRASALLPIIATVSPQKALANNSIEGSAATSVNPDNPV
jgi:hypothetical protein